MGSRLSILNLVSQLGHRSFFLEYFNMRYIKNPNPNVSRTIKHKTSWYI